MSETKKHWFRTGHSKAGQWTDTVSETTPLLESQEVEAGTAHHDRCHSDSQALTEVTGQRFTGSGVQSFLLLLLLLLVLLLLLLLLLLR